MSMCTWSGMISISMMSTEIFAAYSKRSSFNRVSIPFVKILRDEYPSLKTRMPSLWTNSYFVSTVGGAPLDVIKQYIENQKTSQRQKDKLG